MTLNLYFFIVIILAFTYYVLQAYTVELELELTQLKEENEQLKQTVVNTLLIL